MDLLELVLVREEDLRCIAETLTLTTIEVIEEEVTEVIEEALPVHLEEDLE